MAGPPSLEGWVAFWKGGFGGSGGACSAGGVAGEQRLGVLVGLGVLGFFGLGFVLGLQPIWCSNPFGVWASTQLVLPGWQLANLGSSFF